MFTGIVEAMGTIGAVTESATGRRLVIEGPGLFSEMGLGDSIAVNGVCLTVVASDGESIAVDVVRESLDRSNLGRLETGHRVDLERPMPAVGRFDGHIVQGHVDGVGTIQAISDEGEAKRIRIGVTEALARYVVEKGSITVDGVSLTVTAVGEDWFEIVLIPHTLEVTVLGRRVSGDLVNLETDVLAKYVERLMSK